MNNANAIDTTLYRSTKESVNPKLMVTYHYVYETGDFPTYRVKPNKRTVIDPSFAISISEGFGRDRIFVPGRKYYAFTTLLSKVVNLTTENLYQIFPNVNKTEFETDSRMLERFQTEKALSTMGFTTYPAVYVGEADMCYPGIHISSNIGQVTIPMDDAIPIVELLKRFDPIVYSVSMLRFFGKIE